MKINVFLGLSLLAWSLLRPSIAQEVELPVVGEVEKLYSYKDWTLNKVTLEEPYGKDACIAYTETKSEDDVSKLQLVVSKDQKFAPFFVISSTLLDLESETPKLIAKTNSSSLEYHMFPIDSLEKVLGAKSFWYVPNRFEKFYDNLRAKSYVKAFYKKEEEVKSIRFSLRGSSNTLKELTKKCLSKTDLTKFAKQVMKSSATEVSSATALDLFTEQNEIWNAMALIKSLEVEIAAVEKNLAPLKAQKSKLEREILSLSSLITDGKAKQARYTQENASFPGQIASHKKQIASLTAQLAGLEAAFKKAYDVFNPLKKQAELYESSLASIEDDISRAERRISSLKGTIAEHKSVISKLSGRLQSLESEYRSLESDQKRFKSARDSAYDDLRRFDFEAELRDQLSRNYDFRNARSNAEKAREKAREIEATLPRHRDRVNAARERYNRCERQRESVDCSGKKQAVSRAESKLSSARSAVSSAESQVTRSENVIRRLEQTKLKAEQALKRCQDNLSTNPRPGRTCDRFQAAIDKANSNIEKAQRDIEDAKKKARRARSQLSNLEAAVVSAKGELRQCLQRQARLPNCDAEKRDLQEARRKYSNLEDEVQRARRRAQDFRARAARIRTSIESDVRSIEATLQNEVNRLESELDQIEREMDSNISASRNIRNNTLPSAERGLRSAKSDLSAAESRLSASERELNNEKREYISFKSSVGYDAKKRAHDVAYSNLSGTRSTISSLNSGISSMQSKMASNKVQLQELAKNIPEWSSQKDSAQKSAAELSGMMAPMETQLAELSASKSKNEDSVAKSVPLMKGMIEVILK